MLPLLTRASVLCLALATGGADAASSSRKAPAAHIDREAMREARDKTLDTPKLLLPAIQVNIRAGRFPPAEANGVSYLRIPVKVRG